MTFFIANEARYIMISRKNNPNYTYVHIYDHTLTEIWSVTVTTDFSYTNPYPFTLNCNNQLYNVLGMIYERGNTITPQTLEARLKLQNFPSIDSNNVGLNEILRINNEGELSSVSLSSSLYYSSHLYPMLECFVSLGSDGTINKSGKNSTIDVKFGLTTADNTSRSTSSTIPIVAGDDAYLTTHDGVTWFKPPYANDNARSSNSVAYPKPSILITNLDLEPYKNLDLLYVFI